MTDLAAPALPLFGAQPDAVISLVRARAARRRAGDDTPDGRTLGLVIEGGAMRAVCSAGGAAALAHLGFVDVFDEVYATSAGAMNASYFLARQPDSGMRVYFEHCTTRAFFNPLRFWKVIDIDYLLERVVTTDKPLNVARVLSGRPRLFVAVGDRGTGEGRLIEPRVMQAPLLRILKAATAIPIFYNRSIDLEGRASLDGGIAIPFPIHEALARGCTDLLVLLTRPAEYHDVPASWTSRRMFDLLCARGSVGLSRSYASRHLRVNAARDLALGHTPAPSGVNIATICPDASEPVRRTTSDEATLRAAALRYGRSVMRVFGEDADSWDLASLADA